MSPLPEESAKLIEDTLKRYEDYHSRKEGRIWAATVVFVGGLLSITIQDYSSWSAGELFLVSLVAGLSTVIAIAFLRRQYVLREHAAFMVQACSNVLVVQSHPQSEVRSHDLEAVLLPPNPYRQAHVFFPRAIVEAYGEQQSENVDRPWNERSLVMAAIVLFAIAAGLRLLIAWVSAVS